MVSDTDTVARAERKKRSTEARNLLEVGRVADALALYQANLNECRKSLTDDNLDTISAFRDLQIFLDTLILDGDTLVHPNNPNRSQVTATPASGETLHKTTEQHIEISSPTVLVSPVPKVDDQQSRLAQVLADALMPPDPTPPREIVTLGEALNGLCELQPRNRQEFAAAVTTTLERTNYAIRIYPEGRTSRKMIVNASGSLMFQCVGHGNVGVYNRTDSGVIEPRRFELVPYRRQYQRKSSVVVSP